MRYEISVSGLEGLKLEDWKEIGRRLEEIAGMERIDDVPHYNKMLELAGAPGPNFRRVNIDGSSFPINLTYVAKDIFKDEEGKEVILGMERYDHREIEVD